MKNLKTTLLLAFALFATFSFASEKPYLVIEETDESYEVFLKLDNVENIASINILGDYRVGDDKSSLSVSIGADELSSYDDKFALVHKLDGCCTHATYTVLMTDKDGNVSGFPAVNVDFSSLALALN